MLRRVRLLTRYDGPYYSWGGADYMLQLHAEDRARFRNLTQGAGLTSV